MKPFTAEQFERTMRQLECAQKATWTAMVEQDDLTLDERRELAATMGLASDLLLETREVVYDSFLILVETQK